MTNIKDKQRVSKKEGPTNINSRQRIEEVLGGKNTKNYNSGKLPYIKH